MPTLLSIIIGATIVSSVAPTSTTPTTGVNKAVASAKAAQQLWETLLSGFGRVKGDIVIDADILPHLDGKCSDFELVAYKYPTNGDYIVRGRTKAYGDISTGKCSYMLFVEPSRELWMSGSYQGALKSDPPGDVLDLRGDSLRPKRVWAGKTRIFNYRLTKGYIG